LIIKTATIPGYSSLLCYEFARPCLFRGPTVVLILTPGSRSRTERFIVETYPPESRSKGASNTTSIITRRGKDEKKKIQLGTRPERAPRVVLDRVSYRVIWGNRNLDNGARGPPLYITPFPHDLPC